MKSFETVVGMCDYFNDIDDKELIDLCNNIYNWRYVDGKIKENCIVQKMCEKFGWTSLREIEEFAVSEAHRRYGNITLLLLKDHPNYYLK